MMGEAREGGGRRGKDKKDASHQLSVVSCQRAGIGRIRSVSPDG